MVCEEQEVKSMVHVGHCMYIKGQKVKSMVHVGHCMYIKGQKVKSIVHKRTKGQEYGM